MGFTITKTIRPKNLKNLFKFYTSPKIQTPKIPFEFSWIKFNRIKL